MIRIDEIYYNVFARAMQHRPRVGLHWFDPFGSVKFADICNVPPVSGVAEKRIVFWDQEPLYRDFAKEFFDQFSPVYRGDTVVVTSETHSRDVEWVCDTYGTQSCYYFFHGWAALDWYRGYNHSFLSRPWLERDIEAALFCPNNIIGGRRNHRVQLLEALYRRDCIAGNIISFPRQCPFEKRSTQDLFYDLGLDFPRDLTLPLVIDHDHDHAHDSHRIDFWEPAQRAFCHVVTETVYTSDRIHLTEKTFKPIVMQQPFLLVAPAGSLAYLKSYGFRTFDSIWDESYDQLADDQRIEAVADVCHDIDSWCSGQIRDAQHEVAHIVRHNHDWFYHGFQDLLWQEITEMIRSW